jgi:hypothetical protein
LVFVTAYPKGHQEVQFYGQVCAAHVVQLADRFWIRN